MSGKNRIVAMIAATLGCFTLGCATTPTVVLPQTSRCTQPLLTPVQQPTMQQHGDIVISVVPDPPRCEDLVAVSYEATDPPGNLAGIASALAGDEGEQFFERVEARGLYLQEAYGFNVNIVNQSPRVFRGEGMAILYQIDGLDSAVDNSSYSDLLSTTVLPGQQRQVRVSDLDPTRLTDGATIGLYLYDVVTERNDAGVPTVRSNFEWFFAVRDDSVSGLGSQTTCVVSETDVPRDRSFLQTEEQLASSGLACSVS